MTDLDWLVVFVLAAVFILVIGGVLEVRERQAQRDRAAARRRLQRELGRHE